MVFVVDNRREHTLAWVVHVHPGHLAFVRFDDCRFDCCRVVACFVVSHCVALQCEIAIQSSAAAVAIVMMSILPPPTILVR